MAAERQLVLDANILIHAILGRASARSSQTTPSTHRFFAPAVAYDDAAASHDPHPARLAPQSTAVNRASSNRRHRRPHT